MNLKLSKPNLARWEIYEPEASVMVSDGHKLSYYTPDARGKGKGQVIERKAADKRFVSVQLLCMNEMLLGRRYYWPIYEAAVKHDPARLTRKS